MVRNRYDPRPQDRVFACGCQLFALGLLFLAGLTIQSWLWPKLVPVHIHGILLRTASFTVASVCPLISGWMAWGTWKDGDIDKERTDSIGRIKKYTVTRANNPLRFRWEILKLALYGWWGAVVFGFLGLVLPGVLHQ